MRHGCVAEKRIRKSGDRRLTPSGGEKVSTVLRCRRGNLGNEEVGDRSDRADVGDQREGQNDPFECSLVLHGKEF